MEDKEALTTEKIYKLCELAELPFMPIEKSVVQLKRNQDKIFKIKQYRMKSKVQSYDIRDCSEYFGVLELEKLLKDWNGKSFNFNEFNQTNRSSTMRFKNERPQNRNSGLFTEEDVDLDDDDEELNAMELAEAAGFEERAEEATNEKLVEPPVIPVAAEDSSSDDMEEILDTEQEPEGDQRKRIESIMANK